MGQCSELPKHLWEAVEERVVLYADKVRLRSVCASWMYSTLPKLPHQKLHQSPCLLLPTGNHSVTAYGLFSPLDKKFYHLELPELANQGKLLKGSSHGWVVTSEDCSSLCLLVRGNCIYFTDVKSYCPFGEAEFQGTDDMGIYDIDDGLIESLHVSDPESKPGVLEYAKIMKGKKEELEKENKRLEDENEALIVKIAELTEMNVK
ncbi:hypothetical protein Vadar_007815 [Vaccinium darrowii]|uniref:Uncharacterized protein n=1 Tax=Vaccinium darrowii TaxID=229202 RepID=A0ACB7XXX9_9ERIC|nr:hypothetical protein Vadar_007815 [Vaccinium darrowii]